MRTALELLGSPYRDGGADPKGFDCSGFVYYVFARHGHAMPRGVRALSTLGEPASRPAAGDLVFFSTAGDGPTHVGIALGSDRFVHAPSVRGVVRVELLGAPYWARRYVGARRVLRPRPD